MIWWDLRRLLRDIEGADEARVGSGGGEFVAVGGHGARAEPGEVRHVGQEGRVVVAERFRQPEALSA